MKRYLARMKREDAATNREDQARSNVEAALRAYALIVAQRPADPHASRKCIVARLALSGTAGADHLHTFTIIPPVWQPSKYHVGYMNAHLKED